MAPMEMRITDVPAIPHLHDNYGVGTFLHRIFALSNLAYTFANLHRLRADRPLAKAVAEAMQYKFPVHHEHVQNAFTNFATCMYF